MAKITLDEDQVEKLKNLLLDVPKLINKMGKDGKQIEAFWKDTEKALKDAKTEEDKVLIYQSLMLVMLVAKDCTRKFSFDPFKPLRIKCDDIARLLNFEEYKKLRNLS